MTIEIHYEINSQGLLEKSIFSNFIHADVTETKKEEQENINLLQENKAKNNIYHFDGTVNNPFERNNHNRSRKLLNERDR